jgi:hypothetical protein
MSKSQQRAGKCECCDGRDETADTQNRREGWVSLYMWQNIEGEGPGLKPIACELRFMVLKAPAPSGWRQRSIPQGLKPHFIGRIDCQA